MSKVICELCGTAYPETLTQCPICGCVRSVSAQGIPVNSEDSAPERKYEHVKGGRFSKANVRKRATGSQGGTYAKPVKAPPAAQVQHKKKKKKKKKTDSNKGLVITILLLLLAIIAVVAYIFIKFFLPAPAPDETLTEPPVITEEPTDAVEEQTPGVISCVDIVLDTYEINLENAGDHVYLGVTLEPFDTTDELIFESANNSVAMAEADGRITAVRKGETVITVTCGIVSAQCKVTVGVVKPELVLDQQEVVFEKAGDSVNLYSGNIPSDEISWSSDDELVATVEDGLVTAVGEGVTSIYANYDGQIQSCVVRCSFAPVETDPAAEASSESEPAPTQPVSSEYKAPFSLKNLWGGSNSDVTLNKVGETFMLVLVDSTGKQVEGVTWTVENGSSCTVSDGTVRAARSGECDIVATYGGQTYKCHIRVR